MYIIYIKVRTIIYNIPCVCLHSNNTTRTLYIMKKSSTHSSQKECVCVQWKKKRGGEKVFCTAQKRIYYMIHLFI